MSTEVAETRKVITGNHAVSFGVLLSRVQVISAYPITPQTQVVELLSDFCDDGRLRAKFLKVESEHSAMAALVGAASAGARTFTATSSHGLALMHEMLHWAAGARLPIVMANINRSMGAPWSIWTDQNDSLAQRDTGWMQVYCESNQEVLDSVIQAYRIAERVLLPVMLVMDAFVLSHTAEAVTIPDQERVDRFLPAFAPDYRLDVNNPRAFSGLSSPDVYMELRYKIQQAMEEAISEFERADSEFESIFGRRYGLIEAYFADDADLLLITSGTITSTARTVIDRYRSGGERIGLLKIRVFRPFPKALVRGIASGAKKIAVVDRNIGFGSGGIFAQEVRAVLHDRVSVPVCGYIAGLGGRDVTPEVICEIIEDAKATKGSKDTVWVGVKE